MAALPAEEGRSKTLIWCFYIKGVGDYDDWVTFFLVASSIASADIAAVKKYGRYIVLVQFRPYYIVDDKRW